ncbi:type II secretion system protein GspJ [Trichlorobacter ammonificans]|uniref:Type II secretion system protein J n=1 Tax=Trichlorobacter ammonificans TaxID=2916410 RepID=A0ABN8HNG1_9BACT|nr:type II secretion system protein GspJ [Trichlorobacter ammonificans]CAH2031549.1 Type II secretion system protein J [Trichlorobacter ammonificans]
MAAPRRNGGFTLLELLVALAIASLVITAAYGVFFSLNRAQQVAGVDMEQRRALRSALDLLRRELTSLLYRAGDKQLRLLVEDRDFFGKPASNLSFATIAPPADGPVSDQLLLRYLVVEAGEQLKLTRAARDYFLEEEMERVAAYPVLEKLEGFLVECYDGSKWLKNWDTSLTPALPKAIRVTVTLRDRERVVSHRITAVPRITGP